MTREFHSHLTGLEKHVAKAKKELERSKTAHEIKEKRYQSAMESAPETYDALSSKIRSYLFETENPDPHFVGAVLDLYQQINDFSETIELPQWLKGYADDLRSTPIEDENTPIKKRIKKRRKKTRPQATYQQFFDRVKKGRYSSERGDRVLDELGVKGRIRGTYKGIFNRYRNNR